MVVTILTLLTVVEYTLAIYPFQRTEFDLKDVKTYYKEFQSYFTARYNHGNPEETYEVFVNNIKKISVMSKFTTTAKFGINEFSYLTLVQFTAIYTGFNDTGIDNRNLIQFSFKPRENKPTYLNAKNLGEIGFPKYQYKCKNSYLLSAIINIEAQCARLMAYLPTMSIQQGYDCEGTGSCEYGGMPHLVLETFMQQGGVAEEEYYPSGPPAMGEPKNCTVDPRVFALNITGVYRLNVLDEDALLTAYLNYGTLITAIYVSESVKNYHSGILDPFDCDQKPNHAMVIVGYGTDPKTDDKFWILINTWGAHWGEEGYLRLIRGKRACNIGTYVVTNTVDTMRNHFNWAISELTPPMTYPEQTARRKLEVTLPTYKANKEPLSESSSSSDEIKATKAVDDEKDKAPKNTKAKATISKDSDSEPSSLSDEKKAAEVTSEEKETEIRKTKDSDSEPSTSNEEKKATKATAEKKDEVHKTTETNAAIEKESVSKLRLSNHEEKTTKATNEAKIKVTEIGIVNDSDSDLSDEKSVIEATSEVKYKTNEIKKATKAKKTESEPSPERNEKKPTKGTEEETDKAIETRKDKATKTKDDSELSLSSYIKKAIKASEEEKDEDIETRRAKASKTKDIDFKTSLSSDEKKEKDEATRTKKGKPAKARDNNSKSRSLSDKNQSTEVTDEGKKETKKHKHRKTKNAKDTKAKDTKRSKIIKTERKEVTEPMETLAEIVKFKIAEEEEEYNSAGSTQGIVEESYER